MNPNGTIVRQKIVANRRVARHTGGKNNSRAKLMATSISIQPCRAAVARSLPLTTSGERR